MANEIVPCILPVIAGIILVPLGQSSMDIWGHRDWQHQIIQTWNFQPIPKDGVILIKNWCGSQTNGPIRKVSTSIDSSAQGRSFGPKKSEFCPNLYQQDL